MKSILSILFLSCFVAFGAVDVKPNQGGGVGTNVDVMNITNLNVIQNLNVGGNTTNVGDISAAAFYGSGANLTGLPGGGDVTSAMLNGASNYLYFYTRHITNMPQSAEIIIEAQTDVSAGVTNGAEADVHLILTNLVFGTRGSISFSPYNSQRLISVLRGDKEPSFNVTTNTAIPGTNLIIIASEPAILFWEVKRGLGGATNVYYWGYVNNMESGALLSLEQTFLAPIHFDALPTFGTTNLADQMWASNTMNEIAWMGGTFTNAIYSLATSASNGPSPNEIPNASWIRSLFAGAGTSFYATTNISTFTNTDAPQFVYYYSNDIPTYANRAYPGTNALVGAYVGTVASTNRIFQFGPNIVANAYMDSSGGTGAKTISVKCEIYYSYDGTNWYGDWSSASQSITSGVTNLYQFVVSNPQYVATNQTGFFWQRRFKVTAQSGNPTLTLHLGTGYPSHVSLPGLAAAQGNAYLAANQTFSGTNIFTYLPKFGTTNLADQMWVTNTSAGQAWLAMSNSVWAMRSTNDLSAVGTTNIIIDMDVPALEIVVTNNLTFTNWINLNGTTTKSKVIWLYVPSTAYGPYTMTYPAWGTNYGIVWRTNTYPQASAPWTSVTNTGTYVLSVTARGTNLHTSMTEWK